MNGIPSSVVISLSVPAVSRAICSDSITQVPAPVKATTPARMMFLGGDALEGPRHIWWNFVSSSKERIEQAKQDWKTGRFAHVPDEHEFIPLPE